MTGDVDAEAGSRSAARIRPRRRVRVDAAAASRRRPESGPTFEASTPPFAQTKPCGVSVMSTPLLHADDAARLAQDDLDLARVAVPALGERDRLGPRLDRRAGRRPRPRPSTRSSGSRRARRRAGAASAPGVALERVADHAAEVVAGADLGDPVEREDLDPAGLSRHRVAIAAAARLGEDEVLGRVEVERERRRRPRRARAPARRRGHAWPARLSPPNARSMTSGGPSSRAFVPRPWRSGTRTTHRRAGAASPAAAATPASIAAVDDARQVDRQDEDRRRAARDGPARASWSAAVEAARPLLDGARRAAARRSASREDLRDPGVTTTTATSADALTSRGDRRVEQPGSTSAVALLASSAARGASWRSEGAHGHRRRCAEPQAGGRASASPPDDATARRSAASAAMTSRIREPGRAATSRTSRRAGPARRRRS